MSNNPTETVKDYQNYVDQKSPNSPILKNCFNAFWVGGLICSIGQIIMEVCKFRGLSTEISGTVVSILLIAVSAFLTGLNLFNKIGKFAGAGSIVPITGFSNSVTAPAIEFKKEGLRVICLSYKIFTPEDVARFNNECRNAKTASDDYIFALYNQNTFKDIAKLKDDIFFSRQILIYNWDGLPIKILNLNEKVKAISFDKTNNCLYGIACDEHGPKILYKNLTNIL